MIPSLQDGASRLIPWPWALDRVTAVTGSSRNLSTVMNQPDLSSFRFLLVIAGWLCAQAGGLALDIGVARIDVTPREPIRLTGYASRKTNSAGVEQKLWAKALALGRDQDRPALLLTLDNCGIAEETYQQLVNRLARKA